MTQLDDSLSERYGRIHYTGLVHGFTNPLAIAASAQVFGIRPTPPRGARILELGCNDGTNLLSIANSLPNSHCLGLDLMESQIELAKQRQEQAGLKNVEFSAANIEHYDFGQEKFDYIIAHGFLSWVPATAQDRMFEIFQSHLSDYGLAFISFNTLPGCQTRKAFSELFSLEQEGANDASPEFAYTAINRVLAFFESSQDAIQGPHSELIKKTVEYFRSMDQRILMHDEAGEISEPYYLLQVTEWAAEYGLSYVTDIDLRLNWFDIHPQPLKQAIVDAEMPRLKALQYLDYVYNVSFHRAIFCGPKLADSIRSQPSLSDIMDLNASKGPKFQVPSNLISKKLFDYFVNKNGSVPIKSIPEDLEMDINELIRLILIAQVKGVLQLTP